MSLKTMSHFDAINKYVRVQQTRFPECPSNWEMIANKIVKAIVDRDVPTLDGWLNTLNPQLRILFSDVTGMPSKTLRETHESLRALFPQEYSDFILKRNDRRVQSISERQGKADARLCEAAERAPIRLSNGERSTYKEWVLKIIGSGFTVLKEESPSRGVKAWNLYLHGASTFYRIRKRGEMLAIRKALKELGYDEAGNRII